MLVTQAKVSSLSTGAEEGHWQRQPPRARPGPGMGRATLELPQLQPEPAEEMGPYSNNLLHLKDADAPHVEVPISHVYII